MAFLALADPRGFADAAHGIAPRIIAHSVGNTSKRIFRRHDVEDAEAAHRRQPDTGGGGTALAMCRVWPTVSIPNPASAADRAFRPGIVLFLTAAETSAGMDVPKQPSRHWGRTCSPQAGRKPTGG
jgi:hypothetical protein